MNFLKRYFNSWFHQKSDSYNNNSILFNIDKNRNIHLKLNFNHFSSEDSDKFALLLFLMNEGFYTQTFLDLITDFAKQNPQHAQFIQHIISEWSNRITENNTYASMEINTKEDPLIKPTQFHSKNS